MPNPLLLLENLGGRGALQRVLKAQRDTGREHLAWHNAGNSGFIRGGRSNVELPTEDLLQLVPRGERVIVHSHPERSIGLPSVGDINGAWIERAAIGSPPNNFVGRETPFGDAELSHYFVERGVRPQMTASRMLQRLTSDAARRANYDQVLQAAGLFDDKRFASEPAAYIFTRSLFEPDAAGGQLSALMPVNGVDMVPLYDEYYKWAKRNHQLDRCRGGRVKKMAKGGFLNSRLDKVLSSYSVQPPLQQWANSTLRKYITRDMLHPQDPLIEAAGRGVLLEATPEFFARWEHDVGPWHKIKTRPGLDLGSLNVDQRSLTDRLGRDLVSASKQQIVDDIFNESVLQTPKYISKFNTPQERLGALTNLYLRKWSALGDGGNGYKNFDIGSDSPEALRKFYAAVAAANPEGLNSRPTDDEVLALYKQFNDFVKSDEGAGALEALRTNDFTDARNRHHSTLRAQTKALQQMYAHDPAAPYTGRTFPGGMQAAYTPFGISKEEAVQRALATDPYLSKFGDTDTFEYFKYNRLPTPLLHMQDALNTELRAGNISTGALQNGLSMRAAADIVADFNRRTEEAASISKAEQLRALANDKSGIETLHEFPEGWRWDRVLAPARASEEACATGSSWCFREPAIAEKYMKDHLYLLRDPSGAARVAVQHDPLTNSIMQIRNRKQTGVVSKDVVPFAQQIVPLLKPRAVREAENLGVVDWRELLKGAD